MLEVHCIGNFGKHASDDIATPLLVSMILNLAIDKLWYRTSKMLTKMGHTLTRSKEIDLVMYANVDIAPHFRGKRVRYIPFRNFAH